MLYIYIYIIINIYQLKTRSNQSRDNGKYRHARLGRARGRRTANLKPSWRALPGCAVPGRRRGDRPSESAGLDHRDSHHDWHIIKTKIATCEWGPRALSRVHGPLTPARRVSRFASESSTVLSTSGRLDGVHDFTVPPFVYQSCSYANYPHIPGLPINIWKVGICYIKLILCYVPPLLRNKTMLSI